MTSDFRVGRGVQKSNYQWKNEWAIFLATGFEFVYAVAYFYFRRFQRADFVFYVAFDFAILTFKVVEIGIMYYWY